MVAMDDANYEVDGYSQTVDYWSLGVLIVVLLTGKNPFKVSISTWHTRQHST